MFLKHKFILGVFLVITGVFCFSTLGVSYLVKRQNDQNSRNLVLRAAIQTLRTLEGLKEKTVKRVGDFAANSSNVVSMRYMLEIKGHKNIGAYKFVLEVPKEEMVLALARMAHGEGYDGFQVYDGQGDLVLSVSRRQEAVEASFVTNNDQGEQILKSSFLEKGFGADVHWDEKPFTDHTANHLPGPLPDHPKIWFDASSRGPALTGVVPFSPDGSSDSVGLGFYSDSRGEALGCLLFQVNLDQEFVEQLSTELAVEVTLFAGNAMSAGTLAGFDQLPDDYGPEKLSPSPERQDPGLRVDVRSIAGEEYYQTVLPLLKEDSVSGAIGLSLSRQDTLKKTRQTILLLIVIMLICIAGAFPVTIFLAGKLTGQIDVMLAAVKKITGGNLSARAEVTSCDELGTLAAAINQMTGDLHRHVEKLRDSEEQYKNLFDYAPDGILITSFDGRILSFNETLVRIMKYDDHDTFAGLTASDLYMNPDRDRTPLLERLKQEGWIEHYELDSKDQHGQPFHAGLSLRLIQYQGQTCVQSIVRDITPIRRMEAELRDYSANLEQMVEGKTAELRDANHKLLAAYQRAEAIIEELQKTKRALEHSNSELAAVNKNLEETREQLAVSAHQAGMAEIAVSVLHNIGNAVNSVNVRAHSLSKSVAHREIELLERVHGHLKAESSEFEGRRFEGEFKEHVLGCLGSVIEVGKGIQAESMADIEFISKGLDHIMEIIALQQVYAGVRGFESAVDIHRVIKDSVEMLMDSIQRRGIRIELDLLPVPEIIINRNKMMQILINIIKNAYEAIDAAPPDREHRIGVSAFSVAGSEGEAVQIAVVDTGIGLDPALRERVFQFDYSTKGRGTGFGLHDAANYIRAQGGSLDILSKGHGQGAEAIIRLPVAKKDAKMPHGEVI